jgi:hypothetical protein
MWTVDDGFYLQTGSPAIGAGEGGTDIGAYNLASNQSPSNDPVVTLDSAF